MFPLEPPISINMYLINRMDTLDVKLPWIDYNEIHLNGLLLLFSLI